MHVCMLLSERFPPNERVRKEATALREAGHAVTVCARGADGQPERDVVDGIDVRRIPDETLYSGVRGVVDGVRYALGFVHPAWLRAVAQVDDERTVDVCSVHGVSLLKTGLRVGETHDIPVVCDLPEDAHSTSVDERERGRFRRTSRRVFHSSWRRRRIESGVLPDADRVLATCEEARARRVRETGVDPRRMAVVRDTTDRALDTDTDTAIDRPRGLGFDLESGFVVTAFGDLDDAEFETCIEAAARAADNAIDLQLVLVGDASEERLEDLETLAKRRLAGGRVTFRTNAEPDRTVEYVAASDVCVFPRSSPATVSPEFFCAMAMGVPVVVNDGGPTERLVTRADVGRVVPTADATALREVLVSLDDTEIAAELGSNGRRAAEREYHWGHDARRLQAVYESLGDDSDARNGPDSRFERAMRYDPIS